MKKVARLWRCFFVGRGEGEGGVSGRGGDGGGRAVVVLRVGDDASLVVKVPPPPLLLKDPRPRDLAKALWLMDGFDV